MKKSKLITGLSAAFISAMALMSCSSLVKAKDGVVLTIDGIPYTAEELFEDQKTPAAAEAKFNAIYRVAVRAYFKKDPGKKEMKEITRNTKIKISEQKAIAKSNAEKSGTSYDEEWQKILDANDVEDEDGLYDKFEYDLQKEKYEDILYDNNYHTLKNGGHLHGEQEGQEEGTETVPSYFATKMPYHMKHILVKVSAADGDNVTGTITKAEAKKLHDVIVSLAEGNKTFDRVSELNSDDDTAKKNHASLGIMSRDTSFVDDFKLGTYLYEAFYGDTTVNPTAHPKYEATKAETALFGDASSVVHGWADKIKSLVDPTNANTVTTIGNAVGVIPYEAALALGEEDYDDPYSTQQAPRPKKKGLADFEFENQPLFQEAGITKDQFKDKYLPRNVIFNKYFNKHNIMVIAPTTLPKYETEKIFGTDADADSFVKSRGEDIEGSVRTKNRDKYVGDFGDDTHGNYAALNGFKRNIKNGDSLTFNYLGNHKEVLRDEHGRVILVFRSGTGGSSSNEDTGYQGIHFVVIERSPFINKEFDSDANGAERIEPTTLDEYYTVYYPGQTGAKEKHPVYVNDPDKGKDKLTFVNYINSLEPKDKKSKAETVKSELKKIDKLDTYLYNYLLDTGEITFTDRGEKIKESVANWIKISRNDTNWQNTKSWNENWEKFYYSLKAKHDERDEYEDGNLPIVSKLIPEACVIALTQYTTQEHAKHLKQMFGAGGVWHE